VLIIRDLTVALLLFAVLFNAALYSWRATLLGKRAAYFPDEGLGLVEATRAFVTECAALAAVLLLIPIGWVLPMRSGTNGRGPIILVHGWGLNRGALWLLRHRLRRAGWGPVYSFTYPSFRADVERAAVRLHGFIERLTNQQSLTLIGHSLGGLVLRHCAHHCPVPTVRRIITLGTPHSGTLLARVPGPTTGRLAPGSTFLDSLNTADPVPERCDAIALYSTFDAMILPPSNAQYPGAFNIQINDVGHNALLFSSKVYRLLAENLAAPLR